ncbi:MAG TPA: hypothetical protein VN890_09335 [Methylocella sp.]|nr:hypothetical protein [Methylocella sp.]
MKLVLCTGLRVEIKVPKEIIKDCWMFALLAVRLEGFSSHERRPETSVAQGRSGLPSRRRGAGERPAYLEARASGISERWRKITERVASFFAGWFRDGLVSRVSVVA